jgi:hypothetical protein
MGGARRSYRGRESLRALAHCAWTGESGTGERGAEREDFAKPFAICLAARRCG